MEIIRRFGLAAGLLGLGLMFLPSAHACVGCGQDSLFSPKTLAISMSFFLMPVTIVGLIAWKLHRDAKVDAAKASDSSGDTNRDIT